MWECGNCKEQIEDRYKHCWNCGSPKPGAGQDSSPVRIHLKTEPPPKKEIPAKEEIRVENVPPPAEEIPVREEIPPKAEMPLTEDHLFETVIPYEEKSPSKIGKIVPPILWLAAVILVAGFTYYSYEKKMAFENRVREDARNLSGQTAQFTFSPNAPREKNAKVKAKILPLTAQNKQLDNLYYSLPDDLRPATLEEVNTVLWLDCRQVEAGRYEDDGSIAYRDMCNSYLVDRNTAKVVQVEDFLGELPPLKKGWGTSYASGKVQPEAYISYIKANQPETERTAQRFASDSPNHHFWFKSETLYAVILLVLLGAIGIGWIVFKIKSARGKPE